jgi:hypothetical protein
MLQNRFTGLSLLFDLSVASTQDLNTGIQLRLPLLLSKNLIWTDVPHEEGWLRRQENFGEAHLSAADGMVAHTKTWLVSDHPGRCRGHPSQGTGRYAGVCTSE